LGIVSYVVRNIYIDDIEKAIRGEVRPIEAFNASLALLNFKTVEVKIYDLLLKTSLTIKEIEQQLDISERSIRTHIKKLEEEELIIKRVEQGNRLHYVYQSIQIRDAWKKVEKKINSMVGDIAKVIESSDVPPCDGTRD
jgi:predicted transcriptional regulator